MPLYYCRFCNKTYNITNEYYCHLYTHINNYILDKDEISLAIVYHSRRENIKKKSYEKNKTLRKEGIIDYKYTCKICDFKIHTSMGIKVHLIGKHTEEQLLEVGYEKEYIDTLIEERLKRIEYQKKYNKNYNKKQIALPELHNVPPLIPLVLVIPLIKIK